MKANIYSHRQLIGTADLQLGDEGMGCVFGQFLPTDFYVNHTQKDVWSAWKDLDSAALKWETLRLNVQLENGYFLFPIGGITIDDMPEQDEALKRIDIMGLDSDVLQDFFSKTPPNPFMDQPWEEISINQKLGLENELNKELGIVDNPIFNFLIPIQHWHNLAGFRFSALGRGRCSDDVLFSVSKPDADIRFAVVHLTWKGSTEADGFPGVDFYKNFDEFKFFRMIPDKIDWED